MTNLYEALRLAVLAAIEEFKFVRAIQRGQQP